MSYSCIFFTPQTSCKVVGTMQSNLLLSSIFCIYFSHSYDKMPDKGNLTEEGSIWLMFLGYSLSWWWSHSGRTLGSCHKSSTVREQRAINTGGWFTCSFPFRPRPNGMVVQTLWVGLHTLIKSIPHRNVVFWMSYGFYYHELLPMVNKTEHINIISWMMEEVMKPSLPLRSDRQLKVAETGES